VVEAALEDGFGDPLKTGDAASVFGDKLCAGERCPVDELAMPSTACRTAKEDVLTICKRGVDVSDVRQVSVI
jgi:hypothetical protein